MLGSYLMNRRKIRSVGMSLKSRTKNLLLDLAYKGEVAFSRLQGIAYDHPARNGEFALIRQLRSDLKLAFDVGCNVGDWTAEVRAQTNGSCAVVCIEADAANASHLKRRFAGAAGVDIHHVAASDSAGTAFFRVGDGDNSGVGHLAGAPGDGIVEVATTTLDLLALDYPGRDIDLLKADIEGAEMALLRGGAGLFRDKRVAVMVLEYNVTWHEFGTSLRQLFEFSGDHGYTVLCATPFGFARMPRYGIGLEDFRLRNLVLVRPDRLAALDPFGPCGRARVEAGRFS
jgi:FkbM family methyltransferase